LLAPSELEQIAKVCTAIGNEVADESGFVPMRSLLSRFQARLLVRPLLVEGMLASEHGTIDHPEATRWTVLVDQETYPIPDSSVKEESQSSPLPNRLRNTIAHELVHSLAFRSTEFGFRFKNNIDEKDRLADLVKVIERETERFSPLLLLPEQTLRRFLEGRTEQLSIDDLLRARQIAGISRYVFIRRLMLLQSAQDNRLLDSGALRNLAIGIGRWSNQGYAILRSWPLFTNFHRNIVPAFLHSLVKSDIPGNQLSFDPSFAMCGGPEKAVRFRTDAGTQAVPNAEKFVIQVSIEERKRDKDREFCFLVERQDS